MREGLRLRSGRFGHGHMVYDGCIGSIQTVAISYICDHKSKSFTTSHLLQLVYRVNEMSACLQWEKFMRDRRLETPRTHSRVNLCSRSWTATRVAMLPKMDMKLAF